MTSTHPDRTAQQDLARRRREYAEAAMRAQVPQELYPLHMRPDNAQPSAEELASVTPFTRLPLPLAPYTKYSPPRLRPPRFEYGFPITEERVIDFWKRKEPDSVYGFGRDPFFDGALNVCTFTAACGYLTEEIGWVVVFKFVCNATPDGGHVISMCDNYEAVSRGGRPEQQHIGSSVMLLARPLAVLLILVGLMVWIVFLSPIAKLRELLALPPETKPKWYINAAECEWS